MTGSVFILFLDENQIVMSISEIGSNTSGLPPFQTFANFGASIANIGDVTGDGINDLAAGSPRDNDAGPSAGALYFLFLNQSGLVEGFEKLNVNTNPVITNNLQPNDLFGRGLSVFGFNFFFNLCDDYSHIFRLQISTKMELWISMSEYLEITILRGGFIHSLSPFVEVDPIALSEILTRNKQKKKNQTDGLVLEGEQCDDSNIITNDGCSNQCQVEETYQCSGIPSVCIGICGGTFRLEPLSKTQRFLEDSSINGNLCDDGNFDNGDGCSSECQVEEGYLCASEPSVCDSICGGIQRTLI